MARTSTIVGAIGTVALATAVVTWFLWPTTEPPIDTVNTASSLDRSLLEALGHGNGTQRLLPAPDGPIPDGQRLLIVTWDTVRADHTSAYGYARDTTPVLKALAERGVRFADFIVPQSTTLPTHVSMFTGTHPEEHGVIGNSSNGQYAFVPPEGLPTLARHLGAQGYATAGFVSSAPLKRYSGIADGFQMWNEPHVRQRAALATTSAALAWLDQVEEVRPFLLWVHMYDPHAPYRARVDQQGTLGDYDFGPDLEAQGLTDSPFERKKLDRWREQYDLEIAGIDHELGTLIEAVQGRFPDTVITVIGDHGEGLGQHGHKEHGLTWPEQLLAPWVLAAPGLEPRVVSEPTTAADLLPTLAAVATLPAEDVLLARVSGLNAVAEIPADRSILSRTSPRQLQELKKTADLETLSWALTDARWHFTWHPDAPHQLCDRAADPNCLVDVAAAHPDVVKAYSDEVIARRARMNEVATALGSGRTKALGAETAAELKALGYLD